MNNVNKIKKKFVFIFFLVTVSIIAQENNLREFKKIIWEDFLIINSAYVNKPGFKNLDFESYYDEGIKINSINYVEIGIEGRYFFYKIDITFSECFNLKVESKSFNYYLVKDNKNKMVYKFNGFLVSDFWVWDTNMSGSFYDSKDFYNFLIKTNFFSKRECKDYAKYLKNPSNPKSKIFYSNLLKEIFPKTPKLYQSIVLFPYG